MGLPFDLPLAGPSEPGVDPERDAAAAWGAIARIFLAHQTHRDQVAASLGMTMAELIPLFHLDPEHGVSQRDLAEHWSCDPSWVTNRVDRLEGLGLAERRVSATDRRVKEVWLTPEGAARRTRGLEGFAEPPDALRGLPPEQLAELARILAAVDAAIAPDADRPPRHHPPATLTGPAPQEVFAP